jgi:hypothetical protein
MMTRYPFVICSERFYDCIRYIFYVCNVLVTIMPVIFNRRWHDEFQRMTETERSSIIYVTMFLICIGILSIITANIGLIVQKGDKAYQCELIDGKFQAYLVLTIDDSQSLKTIMILVIPATL